MITLIRRYYYKECIVGELILKDKIFYTLELPWLNNQKNISCIPKGIYSVFPLNKSASGKYSDVYHIINVKNRTDILIHSGNTYKDTQGCVLLGKRKGFLGKFPAVLNSKTGLFEFNNLLEKKPFQLIIL